MLLADRHWDRHLGQVRFLDNKKFINEFYLQMFIALQLFFTTLTYPGINLTGSLRLNMYTAPAYLACSMNVFGALALFYFHEDYAGLLNKTMKKKVKKFFTP